MNLKLIERPDKLLDIAFSRARKKASHYKKQKTIFYTIKGKEIAKVDESATYLEERLKQVVIAFPSVNTLDPFYKDLFEFVIDLNETKKALGQMTAVAKIIKNLRRKTIVALKELPYIKEERSMDKAKNISRGYFGRVSSLIKELKNSIEVYNSATIKLKELPSINTRDDVYLLAGLPNVGKSTLLGKVTTSTPKIASYPFTTKGLNVGKFVKKHLNVQVIDTPGLLDRPLSERNRIELKAISAFQHLKGTIIFVVDPLQGIEPQTNLLKELKKLFTDKGFIVVINKTDLVDEEKVRNIKEEFKDYFVLLEGEGLNNLKKEIVD